MATIHYGPAERRRVYESLNSNGRDPNVDYVMLGCPHASIEQIGEAARLLAGKKIRSGSSLWLFTSRAVKSVADLHGYTKTIRDAGGLVMTDTCSAIGRTLPEGTKVVALDSAKQVHYLPAIMGIEAWFGSTEDCIQRGADGSMGGRTAMSTLAPAKIILRGRKVVGGCAEGEALVTRDTISGWGGIDPMTGTVIETHHELRGVSFKDKVLVFPGRQRIVRMVGRVSSGAHRRRRAQGDDLQRHDHQDRAGRRGHARSRRSPISIRTRSR